MHEAPTYLPVDEPLTIPRTASSSRTAPRAEKKAKKAKSDSVITSAPRVMPGSDAAPLPPPPIAPRGSEPSQPQMDARSSQPQFGAGQPPIVPLPGGGFSFDPLAVPLPPELAPNVYSWLRRLALQADLAGADRLLRDALADLTSSLSVVLIYAGPDGLHSLGTEDELPKDQAPIQAVARSRRALVGSHSALVPISTTNETVAVIQLTRNPRQNAFTLIEQVLMAAIARESSGIMHHLVVEHLQRRTEAEADKKSLYRPEALESHRRRGHEGVIAELSPAWVRRTYQILSALMIVAIAFATYVQVPTYSSGTGVVVYDGTPVTAPSPGTIDTVYVQPGQEVHKGDLLVKLSSAKEDADLAQANASFEKEAQAFLFDRSDETVRKQFVEAEHQKRRLEAAVDQKTIRAPKDGTVADMLLVAGTPVQFGDHLLTVIEPGTKPEMWAFLPASDLPRIHSGQKLQIELLGYTKTREQPIIFEVSRNAMGAAEARRTLGPVLADAAKLDQNGSYVLVKARLTASTFEAEHKLYRYHHGMPAKTEVRVESKRFIVTLLPSLEKYL